MENSICMHCYRITRESITMKTVSFHGLVEIIYPICSWETVETRGKNNYFRIMMICRVTFLNSVIMAATVVRQCEFLHQMKPRYALISAGFDNRYGHPAKEVLLRLQQERIPYFCTAEDGAIVIRSVSVFKYLRTAQNDFVIINDR